MRPGKIENHTAKFSAPRGLTETEVGTLYVRHEKMDGLRFMRSAWFPSDAEIAAIRAGAPVLLGISSPNAHPVVNMAVGKIPGDDIPPVPASGELTFAKVGGPPDDWASLRVIDLATGEEIESDVIECDTQAGYIVAVLLNENGQAIFKEGGMQTIKIQGRYKLERRDEI